MIDMSTELARVNFIDADKMQATIAIFKTIECATSNKEALYHCTVDLETREIVSMFANSDELSDEVITHLMRCFNRFYIAYDCIYEQSIAYRDDIKLETHDKFMQAVFYHEFCTSDLEEHFFDEFKK